MRTLITFTLVIVISSSAIAAEHGSQSSVHLPSITHVTTVEGKGWSTDGYSNSNYACQTAYYHAFEQLKMGIALAKTKQLISHSDQTKGWSATVVRDWNQSIGRCTISVLIHITPIQTPHEHFVGNQQNSLLY